jgi:hypothetical protein
LATIKYVPERILARLTADADALAASIPAVLTADLDRYRALALAAAPKITEWEYSLLSHVLSGVEGHGILTGDDALPTPQRIAAEIDTWAGGALDDETLRAGALRQRVVQWSPLTIAGLLFRLREGGRKG